MFVGCDWRISIHFVGFCIFCGQLVVSVIMIDGSKIHKSLAGVVVQSPYVIERRSNDVVYIPDDDQHQISPYNITTWSNLQAIRIN